MAMFSTRIATGVRHLIRPSASSRKVKAASAALPPQTTQSAATITVTGWHPVQPFSTMSQTTASTATSSHGKSRYSFLLYAPDYTDEGCLSRRLAVRSDHLAGAVQLKQKGQLRMLMTLSFSSNLVSLMEFVFMI